jgi:hypothetical protein
MRGRRDFIGKPQLTRMRSYENSDHLGSAIAPMCLESGPSTKPVAIWGRRNGARAARDAQLLADHVRFAVAVQFCSHRKKQMVRRLSSISGKKP